MSMNKIIIIGNLGRDPELRYTPSGTAVCDFSLATTSKGKDGAGESVDTTTWFRATFFGKQAEVAAQYLTKGRQVYIEGRLSQKEWVDRDGNKRTSLEVVGTDMHFIGAKPADGETPASKPATDSKPKAAPRVAPVDDSDIPF